MRFLFDFANKMKESLFLLLYKIANLSSHQRGWYWIGKRGGTMFERSWIVCGFSLHEPNWTVRHTVKLQRLEIDYKCEFELWVVGIMTMECIIWYWVKGKVNGFEDFLYVFFFFNFSVWYFKAVLFMDAFRQTVKFIKHWNIIVLHMQSPVIGSGIWTIKIQKIFYVNVVVVFVLEF